MSHLIPHFSGQRVGTQFEQLFCNLHVKRKAMSSFQLLFKNVSILCQLHDAYFHLFM
jgi:hypothetical protein